MKCGFLQCSDDAKLTNLLWFFECQIKFLEDTQNWWTFSSLFWWQQSTPWSPFLGPPSSTFSVACFNGTTETKVLDPFLNFSLQPLPHQARRYQLVRELTPSKIRSSGGRGWSLIFKFFPAHLLAAARKNLWFYVWAGSLIFCISLNSFNRLFSFTFLLWKSEDN